MTRTTLRPARNAATLKTSSTVCARLAAALLLALSLPLASAQAGIFTIADDNSIASIDTDGSGFFNDPGVFEWFVDGGSQLYQQWFWYRVGDTDPEASIDTLPIIGEFTTNTNFDPADDTLFVVYAGPGFELEVKLSLDGGAPGSGASDMAEQISITNTSNDVLDFHFFQYVDFDINGFSGGDSGVFTNDNAVQQWKGPTSLTETVITPVPSHRELGFFPSIVDALEDPFPTTLSDTPAEGTILGPGDISWAFQWDVAIPIGGTFQISKDKNLIGVIPEPTSLVLLGLASAGLLARRRS